MDYSIKISDEAIIQTMQGVIDNYLKPKFIELGMNATGQWLDSLEARAVNGNGEIWGVDYTYWLVNGRAPNKDQSKKSLARFAVGMAYKNEGFKSWLKVKGLQDYGIQIAYKIGRDGTEYYPNGTDILEVLTSNEVNKYVSETLGDFLIIEINKILKRQLDGSFTRPTE